MLPINGSEVIKFISLGSIAVVQMVKRKIPQCHLVSALPRPTLMTLIRPGELLRAAVAFSYSTGWSDVMPLQLDCCSPCKIAVSAFFFELVKDSIEESCQQCTDAADRGHVAIVTRGRSEYQRRGTPHAHMQVDPFQL